MSDNDIIPPQDFSQGLKPRTKAKQPELPSPAESAAGWEALEPVRLARPDEMPRREPSVMEQLDAGLRLENPLTGLFFNPSPPEFEPSPGYNALTDEDLTDYTNQLELFIDSKSPDETAWLRSRIDQERQWSETAGMLGRVVGAFTNPVPWLGGAIGAGARMGVGSLVATEAGLEATSEVILHNQQTSRTLTESAVNVAAVSMVAGLLGAGAAHIERGALRRAERRAGRDLAEAIEPANVPALDSAGAARKVEEPIEQEGMVGEETIGRLAIGPGARLLKSASPTARRVVQRLVDLPFALRKHERGVTEGPSVEARLGHYEGLWHEGYKQSRAQFTKYRQGGGEMSWTEFDESIGRAMRGADEWYIPEVAAAARGWRRYVDEVKDGAVRVGALPENVAARFADSYFPRMYNFNELGRSDNEFRDMLTRYFELQGMEHVEAFDQATEVLHTMQGGMTAPPGIILLPTAPGVKPRTLNVPDDILDPFLRSRASQVLGKHFRDMGAEIELRTEFGQKRMGDELSQVAREYDDAILEAPTAAEKRKLRSEKHRTLHDIRALLGRMLGTFGAPADPSSTLVRAGRTLRGLSAAAYLGGVTLSSLPDLARPIFQYGLGRYAKGIATFATNPLRWGASKNELRRWGVGLDLLLDTRAQAMADLEQVGTEPVQALAMRAGIPGAENLTLGKITGLSPWMTMVKTFAGGLAADSILDYSARVLAGKAGTRVVQKLARAGIDEGMAVRIAQQHFTHGETDGLRVANTALWSDGVAARTLESAVRSEVNLVTLEPGLADRWLWTSNETGKLVAQFQSFLMSATNRALVAGLQRADAHFFAGLTFSIALGGLTVAVKDAVRGRDPTKRKPDKLLLDAIDRSGMLGVWSHMLQQSRRLAGDVPSRHLGQSTYETGLGPVLGGYLPSAVAETAYTLRGEPRPRHIAKLVPYGNLFHLRDVLERAGAVPYEVPPVKQPR